VDPAHAGLSHRDRREGRDDPSGLDASAAADAPADPAVPAVPADLATPAPPGGLRRWQRTPAALLALWTPAAAAAVVLPPTVTGLAALALLVLALLAMPRGGFAALARGEWALAALVGWLALTALWTPAPAVEALTHWLRYALLAAVPVLALAVPPDAARRALAAFVAAAALLSALQLGGLGAWVSPDSDWATLFHYRGNKSIALAALLALAAALAAHAALAPRLRSAAIGPSGSAALASSGSAALVPPGSLALAPPRGEAPTLWWRAAAALACALCAAAVLAGGASRSGLVMLAAGALWLAATRVRGWRSALVALALLAAATLAAGLWLQQGSGGLALRAAAGQLDESNRQRLALYRGTWAMVQQRPLAGHGVGSWPLRWQQRNTDPVLAPMNTAHQDWLQTAQAGGLPAAGLLAVVFAGWLHRPWRVRAGRAGPHAAPGHGWPGPAPVLLFVGGWALMAGLNAAVRDFAFAAPMALLCGLALAAARPAAAAGPLAASPSPAPGRSPAAGAAG
jgi:O-antigen ligase